MSSDVLGSFFGKNLSGQRTSPKGAACRKGGKHDAIAARIPNRFPASAAGKLRPEPILEDKMHLNCNRSKAAPLRKLFKLLPRSAFLIRSG